MLASMTGYGRVHKQFNHFALTVEIKSINHRFCEINVRMPRQLMLLEEKIKKSILKYIQRGRIEVFITIEGNELVKKSLQLNWDILKQYNSVLNNVKETFELNDEISLNLLFNRPEVLEIVEKDVSNQELEEAVLHTTQLAVQKLKEMRIQEGNQLFEDLRTNLLYIEESCSMVTKIAPDVITQYRNKLYKKVSEYTKGVIDESRVLTEIALFAEKADINEEITRIKSHINQFRSTIEGEEGVIGRKLDFLVQELNREINTIGSKANDIRLSEQVVNMKTRLEKIKEQVQNIE